MNIHEAFKRHVDPKRHAIAAQVVRDVDGVQARVAGRCREEQDHDGRDDLPFFLCLDSVRVLQGRPVAGGRRSLTLRLVDVHPAKVRDGGLQYSPVEEHYGDARCCDEEEGQDRVPRTHDPLLARLARLQFREKDEHREKDAAEAPAGEHEKNCAPISCEVLEHDRMHDGYVPTRRNRIFTDRLLRYVKQNNNKYYYQ